VSGDVRIILSFATEDFVTPEHDDVLLHLATALTERGLVGNFHLTGQLARTLRERNRKDVIDAIARHELGYHSNTHGMSPFIARVFEENSWDEGVAKIMPGEAKGLRDVEEIIGKRAEYFVLEFIKAPQLIHAMGLLGVRLIGYSQYPTQGRGAAWMAGTLCCGGDVLLGLESGPDTPNRLDRMKGKFDKLHERARAGESDGIIRPFLHPYKLITQPKKSWGLINRAYQRELPPHEEWIVPERLPAHVTKRLLAEYDAMLDYMSAGPGARFSPMSELRRIYAKEPAGPIPLTEVAWLAKGMQSRAKAMASDDRSYSPAEIYSLLTGALRRYAETRQLPESVPFRVTLGPVDEPPSDEGKQTVPLSAFLDACRQEDRQIDADGRMSPGLECDGRPVGPGTALGTAAALLLRLIEGERPLGDVSLAPRPALPEIADDPYFQQDTFHRPAIYPDGFTGENICRFCRRQSWTYKPAVPLNESS